MRLELNTRSHKFPWGVSRMGLIIAGIPEFTRLCGLPGLWAILISLMQFWTGFVHPLRTFGLGVGYEWNSRLETLKLDSRIRLLTVFKLSSVAHCRDGNRKINDQPICEHWGSLPHPVPWHCCCAYRPSEPLLAYVALKKSCPSTGVVWLVRFADYTILAGSQFKDIEGYAIDLGQYRT